MKNRTHELTEALIDLQTKADQAKVNYESSRASYERTIKGYSWMVIVRERRLKSAIQALRKISKNTVHLDNVDGNCSDKGFCPKCQANLTLGSITDMLIDMGEKR